MDGELPSADDEIAIDRMYADNNKLKVGDSLTVGGKKLKITGLVALSDYSALYSNPSDMMFDALKFGVAIVTDTLFDDYGEADLHYSYSWKYDKTPADDEEAQDMAEKVMKHINGISMLTQFIPEYSNQAIHFTGDDIKGDNTMITVFLYLVMVIIAFVFAITTGNTIAKEANVIGTLRASGYTKGELVRHYLATPMIVVLVSAIVGNILGYTCFKEFAVKAYYGSYSLPTYKTIWNADAFIKTTVVPLIILFVINLVMLVNKLSLSPLKFLRRDLKKRQKKKAFKLNTRIGILKRFRLRVIFQNIPNYITVFVGILFANVIIFFGLGMKPMLLHYQDIIEDNMISKYQYVLKMPAETKTEGVEKYCSCSLKTVDDKLKEETATIYGVKENSKFVHADIKDGGAFISDGYAQKYNIEVGDEVMLKESYGDKKYNFKVEGIYDDPATIAVYLTDSDFIKTFELEDSVEGQKADGQEPAPQPVRGPAGRSGAGIYAGEGGGRVDVPASEADADLYHYGAGHAGQNAGLFRPDALHDGAPLYHHARAAGGKPHAARLCRAASAFQPGFFHRRHRRRRRHRGRRKGQGHCLLAGAAGREAARDVDARVP